MHYNAMSVGKKNQHLSTMRIIFILVNKNIMPIHNQGRKLWTNLSDEQMKEVKFLPNQVEEYMKTFIHSDQIGFTLEMKLLIQIRKGNQHIDLRT